jgi:molybdenum cofactor biosynthesis enzyme MoaA
MKRDDLFVAADLTTLPFTDLVFVAIEPTSECNLRCVYCVLSNPGAGHVFHTASEEWLASIADALVARRALTVGLNGFGEMTTHPAWEKLARKLAEAGVQLHVVSNLARLLSWDEARTMAAFKQVNVSIDTADPKTLREVRRGADVRSIITNIVQVRAAAAEKSRLPPRAPARCS